VKPIPLLILSLLAAAPAAAEDKIYRCETDEGIVFSDRACGESAEVVEIESSSAGIDIGPPDEVREKLARNREARAEAWAEQQKALAQAPPPPPVQPVIIERQVGYPWWGLPGFGRPPGARPPLRPRPEPPVAPPVRPPLRPGGGDVLRPR
jgi:hypothetical protein